MCATAHAVAPRPNGHVVYVSGGASAGYNTVAYDAVTGTWLWARIYTGKGIGVALPGIAVAASPDGHAV